MDPADYAHESVFNAYDFFRNGTIYSGSSNCADESELTRQPAKGCVT